MQTITYDNGLFLESLLKGDRAYCSELVRNELKSNRSVFDIYEQLIKKSMYEIGELWEFNKISTATEHLASAIIESILNEIYPALVTEEKRDRSVVLACVEKEMHQIGIKMVNDVFEINGWRTYYLGPNTPTPALINFTKDINPALLAISVSLYFHLPLLEQMLQQIHEEMPGLKVFVGGQAFRHGGQDVIAQYKHVIYLPDLNSLDYYLKNFNANG